MKNELINIDGNQIEKIEYRGITVITTDTIGELHKKESFRVVETFNLHSKKFIENVDFFYLDKNEIGSDLISLLKSNAQKGIYLFTERGYLKLVKPFRDDKSWEIQDKLIDCYFQVKEQVTISQLDIDEHCFKLSVNTLRPNEGSKILMLEKYIKSKNCDPCYLPAYTEEKPTKSLTALLQEHGIMFSAFEVNRLLNSFGVLEQKTRKSTKNQIKTFWSLTEKGQRFGKNLISPQNQRETQPHYFEDSFLELMGCIGLAA